MVGFIFRHTVHLYTVELYKSVADNGSHVLAVAHFGVFLPKPNPSIDIQLGNCQIKMVKLLHLLGICDSLAVFGLEVCCEIKTKID